MVPVKEAISSGAWLYCEYSYNNSTFQFRVKVISFNKLDLSEVDRPEKIELPDANCEIWLLGIEILNYLNEPISTSSCSDMLLLADQDNYMFKIFSDIYLRGLSDYSTNARLNRLYNKNVYPGYNIIGIIPFILPIDDEAVYSLSLKHNGIIREA